MLAQEVLESFNTLTTTSQTMLSGGWPLRESLGACGSPRTTKAGQSQSGGTDGVGLFADESIVHETLHPLCTPLSYGGHIKVDPDCLGMVIKLDSRSRTSSDLLELQFFSSQEDMLNGRDPVRAMHGHVPERAARAKAKGMEFFKIEEADSTSYDTAAASASASASTSTKETLPVGALRRSAPPPPPPPPPPLPPASVPLERPSRPSSVGPGTSPGLGLVSSASSSRRPVLTSRAMTRAVFEMNMARRKTQQVKEGQGPVPTNRGNSFRSFALPGVRELWFRFDAPPGAEKPPVQFVSLAGSLDLAETGIGMVKAGAGDVSSSNRGALHDHEEDLSQEELGLQALFTCLGDEGAADAPVPVQASGKRTKSKKADLKDDPELNKTRMQSNAGLAGCLATTADLSLTGGKWFYEATVESLVGSAPSLDGTGGGGGSCGLVRVGWAQADLLVSQHVRDADKIKIGDVRTEQELDGRAGRAGPEALGGEGRMQDQAQVQAQPVGELAGPLMRTVSWLSESAESCSSIQEDPSKHADNGPTGGDTGTGADSAEDNSVLLEADNFERSRLEKTLKSVAFPILGSDARGLGVGLGQEGYAWLGGRPTGRSTSGFAASDAIGCAVDVDSGAAWFSVNGVCAGGNVGAPESAIMLDRLGWGRDGGVRKGISPCLSVRGKSAVSVNFGATPFKYPPPGQEFLPVILRDVPASQQEVAGENM